MSPRSSVGPILSMARSPTKYVTAPSARPIASGMPPPRWNASSVSSNDTDAINAPAPNPITRPVVRVVALRATPIHAPRSRNDDAIPAHHAADSTGAS